MSVIGLTQLNSLLHAAASEFDSWRETAAASSYPASRLNYISGILHAMHGTGHLGPLRPGFDLAFSSIADLGLRLADVSSSLALLHDQFAERQAHEQRTRNT